MISWLVCDRFRGHDWDLNGNYSSKLTAYQQHLRDLSRIGSVEVGDGSDSPSDKSTEPSVQSFTSTARKIKGKTAP